MFHFQVPRVRIASVAKPLAIDLFCGLGGWAEGFLSEGYDVIGFDIERHDYGTGGYPGQLVLQDVLTLDGRQFRNAAVIVASPPCQAYSRRAMPFGGLWLEHNRMDDDGGPPGNYRGKDPIFNDLFRACFRIAREAECPIIVENVKGAQRFVGRAAWHFGSFYLWGDVPALMPMTFATKTVGHANKRDGHGHTRHLTNQRESDGIKVPGMNWSDRSRKAQGFNMEAIKQRGSGRAWFDEALDERRKGGDYFSGEQAENSPPRRGSGLTSRKAASAQIAKIPFPLAQHIARVFKP